MLNARPCMEDRLSGILTRNLRPVSRMHELLRHAGTFWKASMMCRWWHRLETTPKLIHADLCASSVQRQGHNQ